MTVPGFTDPPAAPDRTTMDQDTFVAAWAAFLIWIKNHVPELRAFGDAMEDLANSIATGLFTGSSTSSVAIGTGARSFTVQTGLGFLPGQGVIASHNGANYMRGVVTSYDKATGALVAEIDHATGAGTYTTWSIGLSLASADLSAYLPLAGGTLTGLLTLAADMGLVLTPGDAPASPADGQEWRETGKKMLRIGGTSYEVSLLDRSQSDSNKAFTASTWSGGTISGAAVSGGTVSGAAIAPRGVAAGATTGTLTPNCGTTDTFIAAGLTGAATMAAPSGTPVTEQKLTLYLRDNGTSRAITWTTSAGGFRAGENITLPTATTAGKLVRIACIWNAADGYWDVVAVVKQA